MDRFEVDPFTTVYKTLWELAESSNRLKEVVTLKNRVNLLKAAKETKETLNVADLPELALMPGESVEVKLQRSSSSTSLVKRYEWSIATGEFNPSKIFAVEWALFCCLSAWQTKLTELTYAGKKFVKRVDVASGALGLTDSDKNRGISGWSSLWSLDVEMHFSSAALAAELGA